MAVASVVVTARDRERVVVCLVVAQAGSKKHSEALLPMRTRSLQSQALIQDISSFQLHSREGAVASFCHKQSRRSGG